MLHKLLEPLEARVLLTGDSSLAPVGQPSVVATLPGQAAVLDSIPLSGTNSGLLFVDSSGGLSLQAVDSGGNKIGDAHAISGAGEKVNSIGDEFTTTDGKTWITYQAIENNRGVVKLVQLDSTGAVSVPAIAVSNDNTKSYTEPTVAVNPNDGSVLVGYVASAGESGNNSVVGRLFSAAGVPIGAEFQISTDDNRENVRQVLHGPVADFDPVGGGFDVAYAAQNFDLNNEFNLFDQDILGQRVNTDGSPSGSQQLFFSDTNSSDQLDVPAFLIAPGGGGQILFEIQRYDVSSIGLSLIKSDLMQVTFNSTFTPGSENVLDSTTGQIQEFLEKITQHYAESVAGPYQNSGFVPNAVVLRDYDPETDTFSKSEVQLENTTGTPSLTLQLGVSNPVGQIFYPTANTTDSTATDIKDQPVQIGNTPPTSTSQITGSFSYSSDLSFLAPGGTIFIPEVSIHTDDANPSRIKGKGSIDFVLVNANNPNDIGTIIATKNISLKFKKGQHDTTVVKATSLKLSDSLAPGVYTLKIITDGAIGLPSDVTFADSFPPVQGVNPTFTVQRMIDTKHSGTITDSDGTKVKISVKGAGQLLVIEDSGGGESISISGSNDATKVSVTAKGGDGPMQVNNITASDPVGQLNAPNIDIVHDLKLNRISKIAVGDILDNHTVTLGSSSTPATVSLGHVGGTVLSVGNVKSMTVLSWAGGSITAGDIGQLSVKGDLDADISASSIGKLQVTGSLGGASAASVRNIRIANFVTSASIGSIHNANFFVAMNASATTLPVSSSEFANSSASINSFTAGGFANVNLAAPIFGKITLAGIITSNPSPFGVVAEKIGSYASATTSAQNVFSPQTIEQQDQYSVKTI